VIGCERRHGRCLPIAGRKKPIAYAFKTIQDKMHACCPDGHTDELLLGGTARYLAETRNFSGDAVVDLPAGRGKGAPAPAHDQGRGC